MSEEPITPRKPAKRKRTWLVRGIVYGFLYLIVAGCFGADVALELPYHLACGWAIHAYQTLPLLLAHWHSALLPLAALVVAGWMLHRFIRWAIQAQARSRPWRTSHTLAATGLLLLGYGAAITLIGVAHQSTWLLGEKWVSYNGFLGHLAEVDALSQTRKLTQALEDFHVDKGCYPASLRELKVAPELLLVRTGYGACREPFVYLKPGSKQPDGESHPMIVSPMVGRRQVAVGFTSTGALLMAWEALEKILESDAPEVAPDPALLR